MIIYKILHLNSFQLPIFWHIRTFFALCGISLESWCDLKAYFGAFSAPFHRIYRIYVISADQVQNNTPDWILIVREKKIKGFWYDPCFFLTVDFFHQNYDFNVRRYIAHIFLIIKGPRNISLRKYQRKSGDLRSTN